MKLGGYGLYDPLNINHNKDITGGQRHSAAGNYAGREDAQEPLNQLNRVSKSEKPDGNNGTDMERAFRDMEKDSSLMQYQYFIGSSAVIHDNEDGVVIQKSGFGS